MFRHTYSLFSRLAVAVLTLSVLTPACNDEPAAQETYVLVHGAWMGAWSWDAVTAELEATGAEVIAVELPGHGSDSTPVAELTLGLYVDPVVQAIDAQDQPVILVGHSMAGMVIAQAAEARPDRIHTLVFASAYLPRDGETLLDLAYQDADAITREHLVYHEDGTVGIASDARVEVFCHDCGGGALAELEAGYRPEPGAPLGEPVSLSEAGFGSVPRVYIETTADRAVSVGLQRQMVSATPVDRVFTLDTGHASMLADPAGLAAALLSL